MKKICSLVLIFCLLLSMPLSAQAAEDEVELYAQSMIQYYRYYQEDAKDAIDELVTQMAAVDPQQAAMWGKIMEDWSFIHSQMPVGDGVLPDGLPEDDSLCIVVLGYGLNDDGSMKEELIDRLVVALSSAIKYPNALIAVTGGQTGQVDGITEAGQMSAWLQKKGVSKDRIIVENQSLSTTANAVNVYKILNNSYPKVKSVAVVTSDYHLEWGCTMFTTVSASKSTTSGGRAIELLAGATCETGSTYDSMEQQIWGICTITGISYDTKASKPAYYEADKIPEQTEAAQENAAEEKHPLIQWPKPAQPENQEEAQKTESKTGQIIVVILLIAILFFVIPRKPKKRRQRPEWKWED